MNEKQLIKKLQKLDPKAVVFIERSGEHALLTKRHVEESTFDNVQDADADCDLDGDDAVVVISTWE